MAACGVVVVPFASASCPTGATAVASGCQQKFAANDTFTVPAGITSVSVLVVGGGGGGGKNGDYSTGGGGGGGAAIIELAHAVTPGASIPVMVGAGGIGAVSSDLEGTMGGESAFGTSVIAGGGDGGFRGFGGATALPGAGGSYFGGATPGGGGAGTTDHGMPGSPTVGGNGGAGLDVSASFPGLLPPAYGGGGGGGGSTTGGGAFGSASSASGGGVGATLNDPAGSGANGLGGGGGGGYGSNNAGDGGTGVVVVRFAALPDPAAPAAAITVAAAAPVTAAASASKPKVLANGSIRVTVTATGAGVVRVRSVRIGTSKLGVLCATNAVFTEAGSKTLVCAPTPTAQKLRRDGAIRVRVTMVFKAKGVAKLTTPLGVVVLPKLGAPKPSGTPAAVTG